MSKRDLIKDEIEMDRGVTIDPVDFQVTPELIAKIERKGRLEEMKKILHDETLSDRDILEKLNLSSFSEVRRLKHQIK